MNTAEIIKRFKEIHGDKYDYSKSIYTAYKSKLLITCLIHGDFLQSPEKHINRKNGCPQCNNYSQLGQQGFIQKAKEIHGDKYDYSLVKYKTIKHKIVIICPIHGKFEQTPDTHINKRSGCKLCYFESQKTTLSEFIQKAKEIHGDKYDYSLVEYLYSNVKIIIKHQDHQFEITPNSHLLGYGCTICSNQVSKEQVNIYNYITQLINKELVILEDKSIKNLRLDITIPTKKLAIEFNGIYWHTINNPSLCRYNKVNHLKDKLELAQSHGLRVINIYEHEWKNLRPQIEQIIKNSLGVINTKIMARKCNIWSIDTNDPQWNTRIKSFFEKYHYQGLDYKLNGVAYCLVYDKQIVACAYFGENKYHTQTVCELIRYATKADIKVVGGLSKLVKNFIKYNPNINKIISYCDARLFTGDGYKKAGFTQIGYTDPEINYVIKSSGKFQTCFDVDPSNYHHYYAIPNCGQLIFEFNATHINKI